MRKNNKVCFIIPSLESGGMERVMSEIINYASLQDELQVYLLLYAKTTSKSYSINPSVHILEHKNTSSNKFIYFIQILFFLRKNVKKISPYSVLSFGEKWNNYVLLALAGIKTKIYISDRSHPKKNLGLLHNYLCKFLYPLADGLIVQTKYALDIKNKQFKIQDSIVIANPLYDLPQKKDLILDSQKHRIILNVGRFSYVKNQEFLIKTFISINDKSWFLYLVGDDHASENLKQRFDKLIKSSGFEENIKLFGFTDNISNFYNQAKIFAFTSISEGYPNVVCEALAHGIPVLAYDGGVSHSQLISNGTNGYIIDNGDTTGYQDKLKDLMNDDYLRLYMSPMCRKSVQKLQKDIICSQYIKYIRK